MTEQQKMRILLPVLICLMGGMLAGAFFLEQYRQAEWKHLSEFAEVLIEEDPRSETVVLAALKEYAAGEGRTGEGERLLTGYGYRPEQFGREVRGSLLLVCVLAFAVSAGSFVVSAICSDRYSRKRIRELTAYLERINGGAAAEILSQKEDEFSGLQDELYKTVTALYRTRESAVEAKKNFSDNLANIAHQMKTPLTAALLSLQLPEKPERREQIQKQLERLAVLVESLLTLSKIDTGALKLARDPVDVYTALTLAAENLGDLLAERSIRIFIPDRGRVEFTGDLEWTMEALMNLFKNCAEHSAEGGQIFCSYSENLLYTEIFIWDQGEGFAPEDIPHLFERFYRGKGAEGKGIGIGLPLAKALLELQNGSLTARNMMGAGACFEIRIYHSH